MKRRQSRADLLTFCTEALRPFGHTPAAHHRLLITALEWLTATPNARLMVFMPPGSAKSTYASVLFVAWWLANHPRSNVIGVSYGSDLARSFSKKVQTVITDNSATLGYGLKSENAERWVTTHGSEYLSAGAGAAITGFRSDLVVIDDPVKGREAADSLTIRDKIWNGYLSDIYTRRKPGCRIALIQTRWHEDDLAGRLQQNGDDGWRIIKLPAFATAEDDPLGRQIGEPLWGDDKYGYAADLIAAKTFYEQKGALRDWQSLFQQDPRPGEGALFKTALISTLDAAPTGLTVRAWDLAATAQLGTRDPDWTVGLKLTKTVEGRFVVQDVVRLRGGPDEVEAAIAATASRDGRQVRISLPQDPGQAGKSQVLYLTRKLAGFNVESSPETGDKATRASSVASQCNVGNLSMVRAGWNAPFIDELSGFPSVTKDDQVDALSRAFGMLVAPVVAKLVKIHGI